MTGLHCSGCRNRGPNRCFMAWHLTRPRRPVVRRSPCHEPSSAQANIAGLIMPLSNSCRASKKGSSNILTATDQTISCWPSSKPCGMPNSMVEWKEETGQIFANSKSGPANCTNDPFRNRLPLGSVVRWTTSQVTQAHPCAQIPAPSI